MWNESQDFGELIDRLDNLAHALEMPMPPNFHVTQLKEALPELVADFKKAYVEATGENPWE